MVIPHGKNEGIVANPYGKNQGIVESFTSWGLHSNPRRVKDLGSLHFFHAESPFPLHYNKYDVTFFVYIVYLSKIYRGLKITVEDWKILYGFLLCNVRRMENPLPLFYYVM